MSKNESYRVVYSTESGSHCKDCGNASSKCRCAEKNAARIVGDGVVRVRLEKSGRAGKSVSVIRGLPVTESELAKLGTELKKYCGTGGAVKDGAIEIQGDHIEKLIAELIRRGFAAKRGGG